MLSVAFGLDSWIVGSLERKVLLHWNWEMNDDFLLMRTVVVLWCHEVRTSFYYSQRLRVSGYIII